MYVFRCVCKIGEKQLLALSCLFFHMTQLGSHRTDFQESLCLKIFRKSVAKMPSIIKICPRLLYVYTYALLW